MTAKEKADEMIIRHGYSCAIAICNEVLAELDLQFQGFASSDRVAYWQTVKSILLEL